MATKVNPVTGALDYYEQALPSFRNKLINGNQIIDQRNSGSAGTASANTVTYATDRWYIYSVGATCGYQRVSGPNTSDYAIQITPASSNTNSIVAQKIENINCLDLSNKTVKITGKVFIDNSSGVTFNTNVYIASSANSSYGSLVSFSSTLTSGQYVDFSGTVALGANAINGVEVDFSFLNAAGKTIKLTNLQLEEGTVATPFEHRSHGLEKSLCQRYYEIGYFNAMGYAPGSSHQTGGTVNWNEKRSTPTCTWTTERAGGDNNLSNTAGGNVTQITNSSALFTTQAGTSGNSYVLKSKWTIESEL